mmetsp:Transcript_38640/g.109268  ORF Transcript_38640/g.109268 Transcript_38640/m.109268 type:complete len:222 (+) Transcript_38640:251-916(+)
MTASRSSRSFSPQFRTGAVHSGTVYDERYEVVMPRLPHPINSSEGLDTSQPTTLPFASWASSSPSSGSPSCRSSAANSPWSFALAAVRMLRRTPKLAAPFASRAATKPSRSRRLTASTSWSRSPSIPLATRTRSAPASIHVYSCSSCDQTLGGAPSSFRSCATSSTRLRDAAATSTVFVSKSKPRSDDIAGGVFRASRCSGKTGNEEELYRCLLPQNADGA